MNEYATAAGIAGDLAVAIHRQLIRPGDQVPSQMRLMRSYRVAQATAASALAKLSAAGLTRTVPGRGNFAADLTLVLEPNAVIDLLDASSVCRSIAAGSSDRTATICILGDPDWDHPAADPEKASPPRVLDVSALIRLDRHLLRWMSETFLAAARRIVGHGPAQTDHHAIASARAILRDGALRPDGQAPIAVYGGPAPTGEDVALRIWPERAAPGTGDPPF